MFSNSSPIWFAWGHFIFDVLWCSLLCLAVTGSPKASSVIIANIPTGQGAPREHPFRAAVTFEQHLLSDKLEDRIKEVVEPFPVEVENTNSLWDLDQYTVSLVVWKLVSGEGRLIPRGGQDLMVLALLSVKGPNPGMVPSAFGSSLF